MSLQNWVSISFACFIFLFVFLIRPNNKWHSLAISKLQSSHRLIIAIILLSTILVSILPMPLSPYWNGSMAYKADKQQYARMADALLQGHLYIDNGDIDPILEKMDNPYNKAERERLGLIDYHWDEAYYNHHFYMYFGVVPSVILFIPFKFITGTSLLSYQATQIFASLSIIGIFYLFYILCIRFFTKFPFSQYLLLSSAFSILSIGYSIAAPALYCTAIISAVCLMIWSIVCFIKAVWITKEKKISTGYLVAGGLLGALAFGCRPPVALANVLVIAVIIEIFENTALLNAEKTKKIICLLLPYLFVGVVLMFYNYARFDNAFEFGQSYQLTLADQHSYGSFLTRFDLKKLFFGIIENFYGINGFIDTFPYIFFNGAFINYPILLFSAKLFSKSIAEALQKKGIYSISLFMLFSPLLITFFDVYWSPFLLERYRLDFYYLLCIVSFIVIAAWLEQATGKKRQFLICGVTVLSFAVILVEFLFFCLPYDGSLTFWYPKLLDEIYSGLRFGL